MAIQNEILARRLMFRTPLVLISKDRFHYIVAVLRRRLLENFQSFWPKTGIIENQAAAGLLCIWYRCRRRLLKKLESICPITDIDEQVAVGLLCVWNRCRRGLPKKLETFCPKHDMMTQPDQRILWI